MTDAQSQAIEIRNKLRQKCRTDLLALCKVLGYKDVCREVHGMLLDNLQKFEGGTDTEIRPGIWEYKPSVPLPRLVGSRQNLFLYPRGHLKTSIITIAHSIQAIINYPDIRILISVATGKQIDLVMNGLLNQFRFNQDFHALFPEFCPPPEKASDWGSTEKFTVPARKDYTLKEPTCWTATAGTTIAGGRADFIKHSDLVDEQNVLTPVGIQGLTNHFKHCDPLRERYDARDGFEASVGWVDVEGTTYDFGDLYHEIMQMGTYKVIQESADPRDRANGKPLWPARFPPEELKRIESDIGDWIYSAQYRLKCIPQGDGLCDEKDVVFVPKEVIGQLYPKLRLHCTIDAAGTDPAKRGDNWALTVGGFDYDGRLYILEIQAGRFPPEEIVDRIFDIYRRYPGLIDFKTEAEIHSAMILPFLQREQSKRSIYLPIYTLKRDTTVTKQNRIRGLRPWFKKGVIRFSDGIGKRERMVLMNEIRRFPSQSSGVHDDILDTLADMMQNQDGDGVTYDVIAYENEDPCMQFGRAKPRDRFLGFGENGEAQWLYGPDSRPTQERHPTGIM